MSNDKKIKELEERVKSIESNIAQFFEMVWLKTVGKTILETPDSEFPKDFPVKFVKSSIKASQ